MRELRAAGKSIVFITHKLREVKAVADRITVIRRGKVVGDADPAADETELASLMVGRDVQLVVDKDAARAGRGQPAHQRPLRRRRPRSDHSGRTEPRRARGRDRRAGRCAGQRPGGTGRGHPRRAHPELGLDHVERQGTRRRAARARCWVEGVGYVPEDRQEDGLVGTFTVAENLVLDLYNDEPFGSGAALKLGEIRRNAEPARRGVRRAHLLDQRAGRHPLRRQPAESGAGAGDVASAEAAGRLPADPRRRRRRAGVHPQTHRRRTRPRYPGDHRVHRTRRGARARRPDRGHVPGQDHRHPARRARPATRSA